jgi:hypothetical protein
MATGEAKRLVYKQGMERPRTLPIDSGDYKADLDNYGKPGLKGWGRKPNKYPNRKVVFSIQGTEDEVNGGEKKLTEYITTHPGAFFRIFDLAAAVNYPGSIDVEMPKKPTDPQVRALCTEIDKLLAYIKNNDISINVEIGQEDYQGTTKSRIQRWLPPDEDGEKAGEDEDMDETETEETEDEETEEDEQEEGSEDEDEGEEEPEDEEEPEEEEEKPAKKAAAKKPAAKKPSKKK